MVDLTVVNGSVSGVLDNTDEQYPTIPNLFIDDYPLIDFSVGRQYFLGLTSSEFDPFLELLNADTGEVIATNNNYLLNEVVSAHDASELLIAF